MLSSPDTLGHDNLMGTTNESGLDPSLFGVRTVRLIGFHIWRTNDPWAHMNGLDLTSTDSDDLVTYTSTGVPREGRRMARVQPSLPRFWLPIVDSVWRTSFEKVHGYSVQLAIVDLLPDSFPQVGLQLDSNRFD